MERRAEKEKEVEAVCLAVGTREDAARGGGGNCRDGEARGENLRLQEAGEREEEGVEMERCVEGNCSCGK